jgi:hypothetical protein
MSLPFIDRPPTEQEIERFRLILSTYQDSPSLGEFGERRISNPDLRDFVRTVAAVFGGKGFAHNDKSRGSGFYIILDSEMNSPDLVLSCHMFDARPSHEKDDWNLIGPSGRYNTKRYRNRLRISMHHVSSSLEDYVISRLGRPLQEFPLDQLNKLAPQIGQQFVTLATNYYGTESIRSVSGDEGIGKSYRLILMITEKEQYQLFQFPLTFPNPEKLTWYFTKFGILCADNDYGRVFEWTPRIGPMAWYFLPFEEALWSSPLFQLEPLASLKHIDYGIMTRDKLLKLFALEELERLIETEAKEVAFQKHLEANPWMFGSEYSRLLDIRQFFAGSQLDFALLRAADNYLEIIEIKTPLNGKLLLIKDDSHESYYFSSELSQAIGQAFKYIERIDSHRYAIEREKNVLVNGVRAKIIVGRDGDDDRRNALRRMNSHFHRVEILTYDQLIRIAKQVLRYL